MKKLLILGAIILTAYSSLTAATKAEVRAFLDGKDGIAPGQKDSIQYTGSEYRYLYHGDINQQDGQGVQLFTDGVPVPFNDNNAVGPGTRVKIVGVEVSGIDDFNVGRGQGESGDIVSGPGTTTPLTRLSIDAYVKDGKIRVDASINKAVNVDRIEMQAGLEIDQLAVVDTRKVENGEAPQTFNFEMTIDEFIKQHHITGPTFVYVRLESHDKDGQTQKTKLFNVKIGIRDDQKNFFIYPNPTTATQATLSLPDGQHIISIYNAQGQKLAASQISSTGSYSLSKLFDNILLSEGIYYLSDSTGFITKLVIIK